MEKNLPDFFTIFNLSIAFVGAILLCVLVLIIFSACSPLTAMNHSIKTHYTPHYNTFISPIATPYATELQQQKDGALIIADGSSALLHRLGFVQMATKTIDIQTYIYKNELTSRLLTRELYEAANRGVKIRILIDDNGISSDFYELMMLDNHKNIEVRIFNPYFFRFGMLRAFEAIFDFSRINKRMHNKLFIFDDTALIVGGRNIADEYFENASVNFTDTDLLFIGNIAKDAKLNFEEFWNYKRSIPVHLFPSKRKIKKYLKRAKSPKEQAKQDNIKPEDWEEYIHDIETFKTKYKNKQFHIAWGEGIFLADSPKKIDEGDIPITTPILEALSYNLSHAKQSIIIASSYLVPGIAAMDVWHDFIHQRGIEIKILTNSLASVDVIPVYSHWEKYRDKLALMGVQIYEYPNLESKKAKLKDKVKFYHSSKGKVSLHSKYMIIDSHTIAVGSFNFDYRSAMLNTESIVFFRNEELAMQLRHITESQMQDSYKIVCNINKHKCHWVMQDDHGTQHFFVPPNTSIWLRFYKTLAKIMPEKLL